MANFADNWEKYYKEKEHLCPLELDETLSMAKIVSMPEESGMKMGKLYLHIKDAEVRNLGYLKEKKVLSAGDGSPKTIILRMEPAEFLCNCEFLGREETVDAEPLKAEKADDEDPQKEEWLNQARKERDRLAESEIGQKLLLEYASHNEVYYKTFDLPIVKQLWRQGDVTKQMAADTNGAVVNNTNINDHSYKNSETGEEMTYNENAFYQALMISQNAIYADEEFDPLSSDPPRPEYKEAADAVFKFSDLVNQQTGNTKEQCVPMTREDVYEKVEGQYQDKILQNTIDTVNRTDKMLSAARYLYLKETNPEHMLQAGTEPDLSEYTPREQEMLKRSLAAAIEERKKRMSPGKVLMCSAGKAAIEGICAEFAGRNGEIELVKLEVPEFNLELDEKTLDGETGELIRERLPQMRILYALIYQRVYEKIRSSLLAAGRNAYETEDK